MDERTGTWPHEPGGIRLPAHEQLGVDTMASTHGAPPLRRVRHEVRDGMVVIAFSATASTTFALALLLLVRVAGQGR